MREQEDEEREGEDWKLNQHFLCICAIKFHIPVQALQSDYCQKHSITVHPYAQQQTALVPQTQKPHTQEEVYCNSIIMLYMQLHAAHVV